MRHYIIPIFVSHLGCPHDCVFCNQSKITNIDRNTVNSISGEDVIKIAEEYLKTIDKNNSAIELSFFGGTFTAIEIDRQLDLLKAAKELKDKGLISYIRCSTRPDYIDHTILRRLKAFSMDIIELGIQSLDMDVLNKSGRGHGIDEVINASKLIKEYGFKLGHQIMPGLPGDDFNKDINTARMSIDLKPDMVRIYPTLIVKDTPLEEMYYKNEFIPYSLEEAVFICGQILTMYENADIKVIRCGLQATDEISPNNSLIDGPYHPAFFELVKGKRLISNIDKYLKLFTGKQCENITLGINPKDISVLYADKKRYFNDIKELIKTVKQDSDVKRGMLEIRRGSNLPIIEVCI